MSEPVPSLEQLQQWMQAVITNPAGIRDGINALPARHVLDVAADDIEQVISRSQSQTSIQRLAVYGNAYYARLIECLAAEFPATKQAVGDEAFSGLVYEYLQVSPSTSYTLSDLGVGVPEFLAESRPPREGDAPDWADFVVDLATLERVYSEVFDGPGEEGQPLLSADQLQAIPAERRDEVRLQTAASLRLLELRFPAHEYVSDVRQEREAVFPSPQPTRLAINRRDYIVRRRPLDPLPFDVLRRLHDGEPLGTAIVSAIEESPDLPAPDDLPARVEEWFRTWTAAGYFVGVSTSPNDDHSSTK